MSLWKALQEYNARGQAQDFANNDLPKIYGGSDPNSQALIKYAQSVAGYDNTQMPAILEQLKENKAAQIISGAEDGSSTAPSSVPGVPDMPAGITPQNQAPNLAQLAANPPVAPPIQPITTTQQPNVVAGNDNGQGQTTIDPSALAKLAAGGAQGQTVQTMPTEPVITQLPPPNAPALSQFDRIKKALPYMSKEEQAKVVGQMTENPMWWDQNAGGAGAQPTAIPQPAGNPPPVAAGTPGPAGASANTIPQTPWDNDPALNQYGPQIASKTKALLTGRIPYPNGQQMKQDPGLKFAVTLATQLDPNYSTQTAKTRTDTAESFDPKNKNGQLLQSIDTASGHMSDLIDAYNKIQNSDVQPWNAVTNALAGATNNPRNQAIHQFNTALNSLAPEQAKISSGNPQVPEGEINKMRDTFSYNVPPEVFQSTIQEAASLLKSRSDSMMEEYQRNMGGLTPPNAPKLSPRAAANFKNLGVDMTAQIDPSKKTPLELAQGTPPAASPALAKVAAGGAAPIAAPAPPAGSQAAGNVAPVGTMIKMPDGSTRTKTAQGWQ